MINFYNNIRIKASVTFLYRGPTRPARCYTSSMPFPSLKSPVWSAGVTGKKRMRTPIGIHQRFPSPSRPAQISLTRTRSPRPMASAGTGAGDGAAAQPKAAISHVIFDMDGLLLGISIFSIHVLSIGDVHVLGPIPHSVTGVR